MTEEEKSQLRFASERKLRAGSRASKKQKFGLGDDEGEDTLTHFGTSLSDLPQGEPVVNSDDDADEDQGRLGADFVASQFGGGSDSADKDGGTKTKKEAMEDLMRKSKYFKMERQKEAKANPNNHILFILMYVFVWLVICRSCSRSPTSSTRQDSFLNSTRNSITT
jgi:hypothetical protein